MILSTVIIKENCVFSRSNSEAIEMAMIGFYAVTMTHELGYANKNGKFKRENEKKINEKSGCKGFFIVRCIEICSITMVLCICSDLPIGTQKKTMHRKINSRT